VRRWHEQDRKWEEQVRRWHEQDRKWEEQVRRWHEQDRKWEEQVRRWHEQDRKWEEQVRRWHEQDRKWEEQNRRWYEQLAEIRRLDKRFESTIGALGARWGIASETSFRNALAGILTESFGVEVLNLTLYDREGEVFGRPDQVELDLIIKNGLTIACEIKSSIDKAGMYIFDRKVNFYARHHQRQIDRKIVISPMVDPRARPVAEALGIEIYSYADAVEGL
ncbi:PD-(D/E)XK nuclease family protein, partial [Thermosynechococcus sp.]|uniref:PD-(D/E)XK nuclease family protein n=1 Tax=Thermosynechococcus sp. TaxID=2814275 RepID=UPI00391D9730